MRLRHSLIFCLLLPLVIEAAEPAYQRISLSVNRSGDLKNDILVAVLYAEREDEQAAKASKEVNRLIRQGVERARSEPGVKVQTLTYSTQPIYAKLPGYSGGGRRISGWRVRQSLRLECRNSEQLSALLEELQEGLAVSSIGYSASAETVQQHEAELTREAIAAFRERAELIRQAMGSKGYRLVQMNISANGNRPQPYPVQVAAMEMKSAEAPALEAGTRSLSVNINATIGLQ